MGRAGTFCLILGIGSFVLPMMGVQFRLIQALGPMGPIVGAVLAVVGVILIGLELKNSQSGSAE